MKPKPVLDREDMLIASGAPALRISRWCLGERLVDVIEPVTTEAALVDLLHNRYKASPRMRVELEGTKAIARVLQRPEIRISSQGEQLVFCARAIKLVATLSPPLR